MRNEFNCLTNALLQAGIRCVEPVAFAIPGRVREMVAGMDVSDVRAVAIHQCPQRKGSVVDYKLEVYTKTGLPRVEEFQASHMNAEHDTFVLYDRMRDGPMKYLHLQH